MSKISIEKVIELFDFAVSKSTKKLDNEPEWFQNFQELFKSSIEKKKKTEKDPNAPKKPLTSYIIFCGDKRKSVTSAQPTMAPKDVSKKLAEIWNALSDSEKAVYAKKAEAEKERYANEMKNYSSSSDDEESSSSSSSRSSKSEKKKAPSKEKKVDEKKVLKEDEPKSSHSKKKNEKKVEKHEDEEEEEDHHEEEEEAPKKKTSSKKK